MPLVPDDNPPPLTVAVSLVAIQGVALVGLSLVELFNLEGSQRTVGVSAAVFLALYGAALAACSVALARRQGWTRGPVLLTQLISLGLAWNLREVPMVALLLVVVAGIVLAGLLHPDSVAALAEEP